MGKNVSDLIPLQIWKDINGDVCVIRADKRKVVMSKDLLDLGLPEITVTEHDHWDYRSRHSHKYTSRKQNIPSEANAFLIKKNVAGNSFRAHFYYLTEKEDDTILGMETRTLLSDRVY